MVRLDDVVGAVDANAKHAVAAIITAAGADFLTIWRALAFRIMVGVLYLLFLTSKQV